MSEGVDICIRQNLKYDKEYHIISTKTNRKFKEKKEDNILVPFVDLKSVKL